jgi:hypothetical protein
MKSKFGTYLLQRLFVRHFYALQQPNHIFGTFYDRRLNPKSVAQFLHPILQTRVGCVFCVTKRAHELRTKLATVNKNTLPLCSCSPLLEPASAVREHCFILAILIFKYSILAFESASICCASASIFLSFELPLLKLSIMFSAPCFT